MPIWLRTAIFTFFIPGSAVVWIPRWLLRGRQPIWNDWHAAGGLLIAIGAALYFRCAFDFTTAGRGTPGAWDPPKKLVIRGPYRYVRNPMYIGAGLVLLGEAALYGSYAVLRWFLIFAAAVNLFIFFYEEPTLRRLFGKEYEEYCRRVPRWIPNVGE